MADTNAKLKTYVAAQYVADYPSGHLDVTTLLTRKLKTLTGEWTARVQAVMAAS